MIDRGGREWELNIGFRKIIDNLDNYHFSVLE